MIHLQSTTISLNDIRLYGFHGVSSKEQEVGSEFVIHLTIQAKIPDFQEDSLDNTINYADAYECLLHEFQQPSKTLEHLATRILDALFKRFSQLHETQIEIHKINPPMNARCHSASVKMIVSRQPS